MTQDQDYEVHFIEQKGFLILPPFPGSEANKKWCVMYGLDHLGNFDELPEGIKALVVAAYKDGFSSAIKRKPQNNSWTIEAAREICDSFDVGKWQFEDDKFNPADDIDKEEIAEIILDAYKNAAQQAFAPDGTSKVFNKNI